MKLSTNIAQVPYADNSWFIWAGIKTVTAAQLEAINIIFRKGMSRNDLGNNLTA